MLLDQIKIMIKECELSTEYTFMYNSDIDKFDNAVIITEYGGVPLRDTTLAASRYVQVRLRNEKAQGGYKDMWHIFNRLVTLSEWRNGDFWMQLNIPGIPLPIGLDKKGRQNYVVNLQIITDCKEE